MSHKSLNKVGLSVPYFESPFPVVSGFGCYVENQFGEIWYWFLNFVVISLSSFTIRSLKFSKNFLSISSSTVKLKRKVWKVVSITRSCHSIKFCYIIYKTQLYVLLKNIFTNMWKFKTYYEIFIVLFFKKVKKFLFLYFNFWILSWNIGRGSVSGSSDSLKMWIQCGSGSETLFRISNN